MPTQGTIADADGEIAALVYSGGDRPDLVLGEFARRLTDTGQRTCGLIQFRDRPYDGTHRRVVVLDSGHVVDVARKSDVMGNSRCRFDRDWLDRMGGRVNASIRRGVDAVIVNRFGPLEAAGRGFGFPMKAIWLPSCDQTGWIQSPNSPKARGRPSLV